ncbi:ly6/PLAUR domain-containing protein 6-like [Neosynchiropus ocellatus]
MEPWPSWAWILLLSHVKTALSRDFTANDIIRLHPSTTPFPGGFKCFTCLEAADNYECNRWAPDVYCPRDTRYCYTQHMMDDRGGSVSVTKRCSTREDCLLTGCAYVPDSGYKMCSSCCEGNICNMLVPRNESSAVFSSASPRRDVIWGFLSVTLSCLTSRLI